MLLPYNFLLPPSFPPLASLFHFMCPHSLLLLLYLSYSPYTSSLLLSSVHLSPLYTSSLLFTLLSSIHFFSPLYTSLLYTPLLSSLHLFSPTLLLTLLSSIYFFSPPFCCYFFSTTFRVFKFTFSLPFGVAGESFLYTSFAIPFLEFLSLCPKLVDSLHSFSLSAILYLFPYLSHRSVPCHAYLYLPASFPTVFMLISPFHPHPLS